MIAIKRIRTSEVAGHRRLSAEIVVDGVSRELWFEVEERYGKYLCDERSDAFVLALLQYAFRHGQDIQAEVPMTDRLYEQLTQQFLPAFNKVNKFTTKIIALTAPEVEHPEDGCRIGTGLSCGVDSLHVYAAHHDINLSCVWNTGVLGLSEQIEAIYERAEAFSKEVEIPLLKGWTNFDRAFMSGVQWDGMTTNGNLFCVFAIQKLWKCYYVASGYDITDSHFHGETILADPAHYEYFLFPHICLGNIQVRMDGVAHNRVEKVGDLVKYEPAKHYLNVCFLTNDGHKNGTNDCPKCMRTLLDIDAFGAVNEFKDVFDVEYFHKYQHEYLAEYYRGIIQKNTFMFELTPYFKDRHFPLLMKLKAWKIVFSKAIKKLIRRGKTKHGGFSSKG